MGVSEDYKSVDKLLDNEGEDLDQIGDFLSLDSYECYKKGDTYYYLVEDYTSAGWSCQGSSYYAYSFGGKIEAQELGGFGIQMSLNYRLEGDDYNYVIEMQ